MHYAIVLYMDDEKTAMVKEMAKELAPVCGSDYCLGIEPHITVSAIIADAEEPVRKEAEKLSKALKKGVFRKWKLPFESLLMQLLSPVFLIKEVGDLICDF